MTAKAITIWLQDDVTEALRAPISDFLNEEEPIVAVSHVPKHVMDDVNYQISTRLSPYPPNSDPDPRMRWFSEEGMGLFGSNAVDFYDHLDGDGYLIVCRNV